MNYHFPADLTLAEVHDIVERHNARLGMRAFVRADRGHYVVFNYLVALPGSFPEPTTGHAVVDREHAILRECRGLTFHADGRVAARKYAKFFNVNEKPETQMHSIDWSRDHVVLEKLDGSMITPFVRDDGRVEWHTKMGATGVAQPVGEFVNRAEGGYVEFALFAAEKGVTPIYEWCSRRQRIILDYPEDRLVLTAVRDNATGAFMPYGSLLTLGSEWGVPVVGTLGNPVGDIGRFLRETKGAEGIEGWVIRFDDGHSVKVKGEWYVKIHKTKEVLSFEKDVWDLVLNDRLDDTKAFLTDADRRAIDSFSEEFERSIAAAAKRITDAVERGKAAVGGDRKRFAQEVASKAPPLERAVMFKVFGGDDAVQEIKNVLRRHTGTQTKVDEARPLIGEGVRWDRHYYFAPDLDG